MEENNMRRLMILVMILLTKPVMAETNQPIPIVSSISNFIVELGNIYDAVMAPSVRIPADVPAKEVKCLADNIYFEAKSEPYEGQLAVAQVTINRVEHPQYPKTVCGVVWQQNKDRRTGRKVAQFSWTLDGRPDVPKSKSAYEQAYAVAEEVLLYGTKSAIIGTDTLFYHANYIRPRWSRQMERVAQIGNHIFYQLRT
jgi:spore germination cell wall hydrolase CwlJ-like protein